MPAAIEIESLRKTYIKGKQELFIAVDNLNLTIPSGQVFGFLGPNGAGKTTTIKMICDLILPTQGTIKLNGFNVQSQRSQAMKQIGAILEGNRNVYWQLSPWENLIYFGQLKGFYGSALMSHITSLLHDLELWEMRHEPVGMLSRGNQQKVAIACTLSSNPPILLFDEPTLGLDVKSTRTIKNWIKELAYKYKKTIVITTHQLDTAEYLCDDIGIMNHGKLVVNLPTQELIQAFRHDRYEIKIEKLLSHEHCNALAPFIVSYKSNILLIEVEGEENLHKSLSFITSHHISLASVKRAKNTLEEIFVHLLNQADAFRNNHTTTLLNPHSHHSLNGL